MRRYALFLSILLVAACAGRPHNAGTAELEPPPSDPVEAFEKVGEPIRNERGMTERPDYLSRDIERLQDARRAYEAAQDYRAAELRRRQARCRQSPQGREVPIEDGSADPATYCADPPGAGGTQETE